jgi:hypothetical protein
VLYKRVHEDNVTYDDDSYDIKRYCVEKHQVGLEFHPEFESNRRYVPSATCLEEKKTDGAPQSCGSDLMFTYKAPASRRAAAPRPRAPPPPWQIRGTW